MDSQLSYFQAFLKHPFFQSNMFCVYLSFVDVFQVVLVGIPAALSFTTKDPSYGDSFYNRCVLRSLVILNFERLVIKSAIITKPSKCNKSGNF